MNIVNLTPHSITFILENGEKRTVLPSGIVARVGEISEFVTYYDGIPVYRKRYADTENLPEPTEDTVLIVSAMVRLANPDRTDLVSPGDLIRNEDGVVIGCKGLVVNF